MAMGLSLVAFVVGAVVSLATSWVLVSRLERVGERLGLSEALLGMAAALAADAPEITASVTALLHHQQTVGAGVVVGSNVFNLAALLGLGAVVSGGIALHRKVVLLGGAVAMVVSLICLLAVAGVASPEVGLLVALVVLVPYIVLLGTRRRAATWTSSAATLGCVAGLGRRRGRGRARGGHPPPAGDKHRHVRRRSVRW